MLRTCRQETPMLFWLKSLLVWPNTEHYPDIYLAELRRTTKTLLIGQSLPQDLNSEQPECDENC